MHGRQSRSFVFRIRQIAGVTVTEPLTGKTAVSDKGGSYEIGPFSEDTYTLIFSADGYETQTIPGLDVKTGVVKRLNVEMVPVAKPTMKG